MILKMMILDESKYDNFKDLVTFLCNKYVEYINEVFLNEKVYPMMKKEN